MIKFNRIRPVTIALALLGTVLLIALSAPTPTLAAHSVGQPVTPQIAAGGYHTCALLANGTVQCWGNDVYGQLGNGAPNTDSPTPVSVPGITTATAIAAGFVHTCALLANGTVQCWGDDLEGQLGNGAPNSASPTPVTVAGLTTATALATGFAHTCAVLVNGSVQCWGRDLEGQLGNGAPNTSSPTPVSVTGISTATALAAGGFHTCAVLASGSVQCWGSDTSGQLGNGAPTTSNPTPVSVTGISTATAIAAGGEHTCAVLANGTVQCWGNDFYGQLGNGNPPTDSPTPVSVTGISTATALAAGAYHTCALLATGSVQCWGYDDNGQLGNGAPNTSSPTPVPVSGLTTATAIAAGAYHTCALLATGTVQCWGDDFSGQLGNAAPLTDSSAPVTTLLTQPLGATAIAAGGEHTCAVLANGTVQCWGNDFYGQLGNGNPRTSSPTPVSVTGISTATAIAAGNYHTCALLATGSVQCWGSDDNGQLGDGTVGTPNNNPAPVAVTGITTATAIAAGYYHTCALLATGTVQCWGDDGTGQLGNAAPLTDSPTPVSVSGISTATAIAAGGFHTCALLANGSVQCWGYDSNGQLGNGAPTTDSPTPVPVTGISTATALAAGGFHTCALLASGTVQCWGRDDVGQLGNGAPNTDSPTPVSVSGISTATAIAANTFHTCALLATGSVQCWGWDVSGQLGNGAPNTDSPTPVTVSGISTATAIAGGGFHTCALLANGSVQCWGEDGSGQLGNGSPNTSSPTPVGVSLFFQVFLPLLRR